LISNLKIRTATPADIPELISLERYSATAAHWSAAQHESLFEPDAPPRTTLLLQKDSRIAGFLVARAIGPEWEIENIVVAGWARRTGLGTRLLCEFLKSARRSGAQSVFLEVRESNLAARGLYEKWAFVESGRRSSYYREPAEDAITYRLSFV
jgi:[ribosomal protein S18]-alanine N-acetyltransferase